MAENEKFLNQHFYFKTVSVTLKIKARYTTLG